MESREDDALRDAVDGAAFTVPDGQPLAWALRALGHEIDTRVYGPELMDRACARAARGLPHRAAPPEAASSGIDFRESLRLRRADYGS